MNKIQKDKVLLKLLGVNYACARVPRKHHPPGPRMKYSQTSLLFCFQQVPMKVTNFVTSFLRAVHAEDNNLLLLACAAEACKTDHQVSTLLLNLGLDCQKTNLPGKVEKMFSLLFKIPTQIDKGEKKYTYEEHY